MPEFTDETDENLEFPEDWLGDCKPQSDLVGDMLIPLLRFCQALANLLGNPKLAGRLGDYLDNSKESQIQFVELAEQTEDMLLVSSWKLIQMKRRLERFKVSHLILDLLNAAAERGVDVVLAEIL